MKYASIGSISHGTLRMEDLLDSFTSELEYCVTQNPELEMVERERLTHLVWDAREADPESEDADWLVGDLIDALDGFAPPYCYFGANEGDGSDFGFWPDTDQIDELPKVSDPSEVDGFGEDCAFVNDHGNVTVYGADGSILIDMV